MKLTGKPSPRAIGCRAGRGAFNWPWSAGRPAVTLPHGPARWQRSVTSANEGGIPADPRPSERTMGGSRYLVFARDGILVGNVRPGTASRLASRSTRRSWEYKYSTAVGVATSRNGPAATSTYRGPEPWTVDEGQYRNIAHWRYQSIGFAGRGTCAVDRKRPALGLQTCGRWTWCAAARRSSPVT